jgi:hypothetical protein
MTRFAVTLLWVLFVAGVFVPSAIWGYDTQPQPSIAYDGPSSSSFDYDSASARVAAEKENPTARKVSLLADFARSVAAKTGAALPEGSFSIANWSGYPANLPKPTGPFRLLEGAEYDAARAAANQANRAMHQADPALRGLQLHEIQPVKFGGSSTDPLNKIPLTSGRRRRLRWQRLRHPLACQRVA